MPLHYWRSFIILINVEMTTSYNICKDLLVVLKIQRRLIDKGRSFVNQRNKCVYFNQLYFSSYHLKCRTLFINVNNMICRNRSSNNKMMTNQMTNNNKTMTNHMTSRGTLPPYILINDLASLVTIDIFVFSFWICFEFKWICFSICFGLMNLSIWLIKEYWDMFQVNIFLFYYSNKRIFFWFYCIFYFPFFFIFYGFYQNLTYFTSNFLILVNFILCPCAKVTR